MDNSLAAGRRLAAKVILMQLAVAVVAGLAFVWRGAPAAVGAFAGGALAALGTTVLALRVFMPALAGGGTMALRFATGTLLKWVVVLVGLYLIFAYWKLPAVPALAGFGAALVVNLAALKFER